MATNSDNQVQRSVWKFIHIHSRGERSNVVCNIFDGVVPKTSLLLMQHATGVVRWFNVKNGYGFITHSDTHEDVFVHWTATLNNNPHGMRCRVAEGETVEFDIVVGKKGLQATNMTVLESTAVHGGPYAVEVNKPWFRSCWFPQHDRRHALNSDIVSYQGTILQICLFPRYPACFWITNTSWKLWDVPR